MKSDIEIARETPLKPIRDIAQGLGISEEVMEPYGRYIAKLPLSLIDEEKISKSRERSVRGFLTWDGLFLQGKKTVLLEKGTKRKKIFVYLWKNSKHSRESAF